jgi:hypothetical protein
MPWVDVVIPMRPSRDGGGESALVPLSDIKPRPGRRSTQVGAQRCVGFTTALHYFEALFTQDICDTFIAATNSYAAAVNRAEWTDVTVSEFKVFLALVLYFGVVTLPSRRMAWGNGSMYRIPWVVSMMTLRRFEAILNAWHWIDATSLSDAERRRRNKANPYWTVQGFVDALGKTFEEHYTCPQCFDIDEQCIPWKGRHQAKCYNPSKPAKWHLKVYALNCAETCYQLKFFMYEGRSEARPAGMPATVYPVWRLLKDGKYHHNGCILYLDNWYTSLSVVRLMLSMGIHCVGTVRTNKAGLPKEAVFPKSGRGKRARGDMKCVVKSFGPDQDIYFTAWMDSKPVHLLHTTKPYKQTVERAQKGTSARVLVPQPSVIEDYNFGMRGTDGIDQKISYYRNEMRCKKWQPRLFMHFIHAAVNNSHILYKLQSGAERGDDGFALLDYTTLLIQQLCEDNKAVEIETKSPVRRKKSRPLDVCLADPDRLTGHHFPDMYRRRAEDAGSDMRRACKMCGKKVPVRCEQCDVPLCIEAPAVVNSCWVEFHTAPLSYRTTKKK